MLQISKPKPPRCEQTQHIMRGRELVAMTAAENMGLLLCRFLFQGMCQQTLGVT